MKNRRQSDKFNIDLDLTSMLDVIFVILMVVMCRQLLTNVRDNETIKTAAAELEAVKADNELYAMQLKNLENPENSVNFVSVYANFEQNDPHVRHLKLTVGDSAVIEDLVIKPDTEESVFGEFADRLSSILSADPDIPVLLTINDQNILYRDHIRIEEILSSLKDDNPNLFMKPAQRGK